MNMPGQDENQGLKRPTVATAANQCLEAFQQCLVMASSIHPRELSMVEDQLARFSSWANGIGVFAGGSASMDHRLRYTPEVQGIVIALLESLGYRINICLNTLDMLIKSPIVEPSNSSNKQLGRSFLDIAAEITGLNKISNTIRRASNETQLLKASKFTIKDDEGTNIEPTLLHHFQRHIGDWFPDISDNIQQRLARAMLLRRKRILYRRYRQGGHAIRPEPTATKVSVVLPDAQLAEQPTGRVGTEQQSSKTTTKGSKSTVTASHVRSATTLAAEKFKRMAAAPSVVSTNRTIASGKHQALVYPPAPGYAVKRRYEQFKAEKVAEGFGIQSKPTLQELLESNLQTIGEIACPYCLCVLPAVEVFNERKWQNHVKNDLDAYVCLFEDCADADNLYTHSHEWLDHSHQHARIWRCTSHREIDPFSTAEEFKQHVRETHKGTYSESKLCSMADKSSRKTNKLFQSCPLCGKAESDIDGRLEDHITGHLRSLALKSLPPYQDEIPDDVTDNDNNSVGGSRPRSRSTLRDEMEGSQGEEESWDDWKPPRIRTQYHTSHNFLGDAHTTLDLSNGDVWDASMFFDRLIFKDLRRFAKELTVHDLDDPILQTMVQHQGHRVISMAEPEGTIITRDEETANDGTATIAAQHEVESSDKEVQQSVNADETSDDDAVGSSNTDKIAFAHMGAWMDTDAQQKMMSEDVDVSDDNAYKTDDTNANHNELRNTADELIASNLEFVDSQSKQNNAPGFNWKEKEYLSSQLDDDDAASLQSLVPFPDETMAREVPHHDNDSDSSNWSTSAVHHIPPRRRLRQTSSSNHRFRAPQATATTTKPLQPGQHPIEPLMLEADAQGPGYVRSETVDGELYYFYDDGTQCKSIIDGEPVNPHWGVTKDGKPRKRFDSTSIVAPRPNDDDELSTGELSDVQITRHRSRDDKRGKALDPNQETGYYSDDDEDYRPVHRRPIRLPVPAIVLDKPEYTPPYSGNALDFVKAKTSQDSDEEPSPMELHYQQQDTVLNSSIARQPHGTSHIARDKEALPPLQKEPSSASDISKVASITLPCEFDKYTGCEAKFGADETTEWINHNASAHLHYTFPNQTLCWFCDDRSFVAASDTMDDRREAYYARMQHVSDHITRGDMSIQDIRPDFLFLDHIFANGFIDEQTWRQFMSYDELNQQFQFQRPPAPTGRTRRRSVIVERPPSRGPTSQTAPKSVPTPRLEPPIESFSRQISATERLIRRVDLYASLYTPDDIPNRATQAEHTVSDDEKHEQYRRDHETRRKAMQDTEGQRRIEARLSYGFDDNDGQQKEPRLPVIQEPSANSRARESKEDATRRRESRLHARRQRHGKQYDEAQIQDIIDRIAKVNAEIASRPAMPTSLPKAERKDEK